jgi:hypothetical protein
VRTVRLRVRARVDRVRYSIGHEWPVLLSAVGVLIGVVTVLPSAVGVVLSVVALVLGVVTLVRDVRGFRRRWARHDFARVVAPFPTSELPPPAAYPEDASYLAVPNRGVGLVSDDIDRALTEGDMRFTVAEQPYRLPQRLRATAPYVLPRSTRHQVVFNGLVVGMRGDPLPPETVSVGALTLHRASFFDALCSNEICRYLITDRETGAEFDPRRELLADAGGRLRTLAESELSELVGVSTIAVTSDGVLVLVRQSSRNIASEDLLAPSGSGSLEPRDLDGATSLQDAMRRGMERELREESGIPAEHIVATRVVGFARWMERGAKPEFFGLTTLSVAASELRLGKVTGDERLYSANVQQVPMDLGELRRELAAGTELLDAPSLPRQIRDQGALPLLLAVRAAALRG